MGSISRAEMAAAQVIDSDLWAATLATCAPQGGLLSVLQATPSLNQNQEVVSQVVGALQPSIARAVAEALAGLNSRSVSTSSRGSVSTGSRLEVLCPPFPAPPGLVLGLLKLPRELLLKPSLREPTLRGQQQGRCTLSSSKWQMMGSRPTSPTRRPGMGT